MCFQNMFKLSTKVRSIAPEPSSRIAHTSDQTLNITSNEISLLIVNFFIDIIITAVVYKAI